MLNKCCVIIHFTGHFPVPPKNVADGYYKVRNFVLICCCFRAFNIDTEMLSTKEIQKLIPLDMRTDDILVSYHNGELMQWVYMPHPVSRVGD